MKTSYEEKAVGADTAPNTTKDACAISTECADQMRTLSNLEVLIVAGGPEGTVTTGIG